MLRACPELYNGGHSLSRPTEHNRQTNLPFFPYTIDAVNDYGSFLWKKEEEQQRVNIRHAMTTNYLPHAHIQMELFPSRVSRHQSEM